MKKRLFLSIAAVLWGIFNVCSQTVSVKQAEKLANNFINYNYYPDKLDNFLQFSQLNLVKTVSKNGSPVYYIFNFKKTDGFIIISATNSAQPVLGFSFSNNYLSDDEKPEQFDAFLDHISTQLGQLPVQKNEMAINAEKEWAELSDRNALSKKERDTLIYDVAPLITANWGQGCGYNNFCPEDDAGYCGHALVGCVAVATGQVMSKWDYPATGTGSSCYDHWKYGQLCADYENTTYDWANMTDDSGNDAVATILSHCGISETMGYGTSGSGTMSESAGIALKKYFKYSQDLIWTFKNGYTDDNWNKLIKSEIDAGRPVIYSGGNHAFNVDGYKNDNFFHVNWGWSGSYNGYFYLNDLTPGSSNFTSGALAIVGIIPETLYTGLSNANVQALSCNTPFSGNTENGANNVNRYNKKDGSWAGFDQTGKEQLFSITTAQKGTIKAHLSNIGDNNLDVFILTHLHCDSVIAFGDESAAAHNCPSGTYYIVVDGAKGASGDFTLTASCPADQPDLYAEGFVLGQRYLESLQTGVKLSYKLMNVGSKDAGSSKVKFYYSSDNQLNPGDIFIESKEFNSVTAGESLDVNSFITMPDNLPEGDAYILMLLDGDNEVAETDENDNLYYVKTEIVPQGKLDCSNAVTLLDDEWYWGNTELLGDSLIDMYSGDGMTGNEVVHVYTPDFDGVLELDVTEKSGGKLSFMFLKSCNENLVDHYAGVYGNDTISTAKYAVSANQTYYIVVDAKKDYSGSYGIRARFPEKCATPKIEVQFTDKCKGDSKSSFYVNGGYDTYQWYKDGFPIMNETDNSFWNEDGSGGYYAEITANGCTFYTDTVTLTYSPKPEAPVISSVETETCEGNSIELKLTSPANDYSFQWIKGYNDNIDGETGKTYYANESGSYKIAVTNKSCTVESDKIDIYIKPAATDIGNILPISSDNLSYAWLFPAHRYSEDATGNWQTLYGNNNPVQVADRDGREKEAIMLNGTDQYLFTYSKQNNPNVFSVNIWFKTTTAKGGRIVGFGNSSSGESSESDRHIYMANDGRLHFGVYHNWQVQTVGSSQPYNDGQWHMATAMLSADGMKLYVDKKLVGQNASVTSGWDFEGYWRVGWDNLDGWNHKPASSYFEGSVDDIRIYSRKVTEEELKVLYENLIVDIAVSQTDFCGSNSGQAEIEIVNSQPGIQYLLRNNSDNSPIGSAQSGNAETLTFKTGSLNKTTSFNIFSTVTATGCERQLDTIITIKVSPAQPQVTIEADKTIPMGTATTISASTTGGAGDYIYQWSPEDGLIDATVESPETVSLRSDVTYSVTVTDKNHCTAEDEIKISVVGDPLKVTASVDKEQINAGETITLDVSVSGGSGSYTYSWTSIPVGFTSNEKSPSVGPTADTEYMVEVHDGSQTVTSSIKVTVIHKQTIELVAGWNLISFNLEPEIKDIKIVLPNAKIVKTFNLFFDADQDEFLNSLSTIEAGKGYLVYNAIDEKVEITGILVKTNGHASLQTGWNLIGVPFSESTTFEDAFGTELPNIKVIKDFDGFWQNGGLLNSLEKLEPGKAYFVKQ